MHSKPTCCGRNAALRYYVNAQVTHVLEGHAALTLRSRLRCILMRKEDELNNVSGSPYNIRTMKIIDLL
jgi:hypothetical protein